MFDNVSGIPKRKAYPGSISHPEEMSKVVKSTAGAVLPFEYLLIKKLAEKQRI